MLRFCLMLMSSLFSLSVASCTNAETGKALEVQNIEMPLAFEELVQSVNLIVIAEIVEQPSVSDDSKERVEKPDAVKIDLEKEIDRAREATEETARTFTGLGLAPFVQLKTVKTLKGPKTNILSIEASTDELKIAEPGQLYVIFMGVNHPDAIKQISSLSDPWVQKIQEELAQ